MAGGRGRCEDVVEPTTDLVPELDPALDWWKQTRAPRGTNSSWRSLEFIPSGPTRAGSGRSAGNKNQADTRLARAKASSLSHSSDWISTDRMMLLPDSNSNSNPNSDPGPSREPLLEPEADHSRWWRKSSSFPLDSMLAWQPNNTTQLNSRRRHGRKQAQVTHCKRRRPTM